MTSHFSVLRSLAVLAAALLGTSCQMGGYSRDVAPRAVVRNGVAVTVYDQKLTVYRGGKKVKDYDVSTSKFGLGNTTGSRRTPLGIHAVSDKTGEGQPKGMVFKGARPTGEVVAVDAAGRDPVVTRVIQLAGLENSNKNSHSRRIYIHGTPEERKIGRPASYGCIRMKSNDVIDLYRRVQRGTPVVVETCSQKTYEEALRKPGIRSIEIPSAIVANLPVDKVQLRPVEHHRRLVATRKSRAAQLRLVSTKKGSGRGSIGKNVAKNSGRGGAKGRATAKNTKTSPKRIAYRKGGKKRRG